MTYSIIGTGNVGLTLAGIFSRAGIDVAIANTRGPATIEPLIASLGQSVTAATLDAALEAHVIFFAVPFLNFKDVAATRSDWTGKIVIDVTNAAFLPLDVQERELQGRLSSEVNADRVPGANLVKAFNQLPMKGLVAPVAIPDGRRVVFVSSDDEASSALVAKLVSDLGYAPIELGKIAEGGRLIQARNALIFQNLIKVG
ncbi:MULTISPECIES: NADPH-dependent F420 reductase [Hyphomicrobiales]|uniref:NAD(P)-binding domain-containing protein n=1 Tax=Mesorhizobium huakuii TaxID=28104 RepID=A0ABZ0VXV1_9HYPH|nr:MULTISPECIES: NAD(P)-binding domain-containing protein [Hyphomicrobiales]WEZ85321.1 NAD(P)-binding domain-containing protein [Rhizobium sp. 32-5/1]WQC01115.1 NAD(P)-binding domain-containing protein [Mesorhizobium huakuii]